MATVSEFIAPSKNKHRKLPWEYAPYICSIWSVVYYWKLFYFVQQICDHQQ